MSLSSLKETLKQAKFSEKEIEVYTSLLQLGSSVASEIGKHAKINRSTTYVILDTLLERGLVTARDRRGAKVYVANPPEALVKHFEEAGRSYGELASTVKKMLPQLKSQYATATPKPRVRFYEGAEGVKTVYEDALTSLETIRTYALSKEGNEAATEDAKKYYDRLAKKNIKVRVLLPETSEARELTGKKGKGVLSAMPRDFVPEISIYDSKITFTSREEEFALIIESKELAEALKKAFDLSWKENKQGSHGTSLAFSGGAA